MDDLLDKGTCTWCKKPVTLAMKNGVTPIYLNETGHATCPDRPYTTDPILHWPE